MRLHHPPLRLGDDEGEALERERGPQPDVPGEAGLGRGAERRGAQSAHQAVRPVGAHDQVVGGAERLEVAHLAAVAHLDAELLGALGEDAEQPAAGDGGEAVTAGADHPAAVHDVDVRPGAELRLDPAKADRIGGADVGEGLVGEHHPEAEGVVGAVALEHRHPVRRVAEPEQDAEEQPAGAAADADDVHQRAGSGITAVVTTSTSAAGSTSSVTPSSAIAGKCRPKWRR